MKKSELKQLIREILDASVTAEGGGAPKSSPDEKSKTKIERAIGALITDRKNPVDIEDILFVVNRWIKGHKHAVSSGPSSTDTRYNDNGDVDPNGMYDSGGNLSDINEGGGAPKSSHSENSKESLRIRDFLVKFLKREKLDGIDKDAVLRTINLLKLAEEDLGPINTRTPANWNPHSMDEGEEIDWQSDPTTSREFEKSDVNQSEFDRKINPNSYKPNGKSTFYFFNITPEKEQHARDRGIRKLKSGKWALVSNRGEISPSWKTDLEHDFGPSKKWIPTN